MNKEGTQNRRQFVMDGRLENIVETVLGLQVQRPCIHDTRPSKNEGHKTSQQSRVFLTLRLRDVGEMSNCYLWD